MASKLQKKNNKWTFRYFEGDKQKRFICLSPIKQDAEQEKVDFLHSLALPQNQNINRALWAAAVVKFMVYIKNNRLGYDTYQTNLAKLTQFLNPHKITDITTAKISGYIEHCLKNNLSKSTINRRLNSVSALFNWLRNIEGYNIINPIHSIKRFAVKKIVKTRILSKDEINRIFFCLDENKTPEGKDLNIKENTRIMLKALFFLALYAGLRLKECKLLRREHILFDENSLIVEPHKTAGTNPNNAAIPLNTRLKAFLLALLKENRDDAYVIPYIDIERRKSNENTISLIARKFLKLIKIKEASLHTCRHSYISSLANSDVDSADILKYARLTSLETLEIYRHITPQKHQENINKLYSD
jgi:integrase